MRVVHVSHPWTTRSPAARAPDVRRSPGAVHPLRSSQLQPWSSSGVTLIVPPWWQRRNISFLSRSLLTALLKCFQICNGKQHIRVAVYSQTQTEKIQGQSPSPQPQGGCHRLYMTPFCLIKCLFCLLKCLFPCTNSIQLQGWMSWSYLCLKIL